MNTHYKVRTENKRTHGKGQYALRNTVYQLLNTRTWKANLSVRKKLKNAGTERAHSANPTC